MKVKNMRLACLLVLTFCSVLYAGAKGIEDIFTAPEGVSIEVYNSKYYPWTVNSDGVLMSNMHSDEGATSVSFKNTSDRDLCCSFEWSVSSQGDCDNITFACDGNFTQTLSGNLYYRGSLVYMTIFCYVRAGEALEFTYYKDEFGSSGDDAGYVKNIVFSFPDENDTYPELGFSLPLLSTAKTAAINGYYGIGGELVIPKTIVRGGTVYTVNSIKDDSFRENENITSAVIEANVSELGVHAFYGCSNLASVEMSNSITTVGTGVFERCAKLESVNMSNRLTSISNLMFEGCTSLKSIDIPSSVKTIGNSAFQNCRSLQSVDIPASVTAIDYFAFDRCENLKSVFLPSSVNAIMGNVFSRCGNVESMVVDAANTSYDSRNGCNAIIEKSSSVLVSGCKNTVVPSDVVGLGSYAFYGCTGLTSLELPTSVFGISYNAFQDCVNLKSISLPSVVTLGSYTFYNCSSLETIELGETLRGIGPNAFFGCSSLATVSLPSSLQSIDSYAFGYCKSLTSITLPSSVKSLPADLFSYCEKLKYVTIEGELNDVESSTFRNCRSLSSVVLKSSNIAYLKSGSSFTTGYTSGHYTPFSNCTLFVPKGSEEAYRSATGWKQFGSVNTIAEQADYGLFVSKEGCGHAGHQMALQVEMNNVGPVSLWQADVVLPEGFKLANVEDAIKLNAERTEDTDISIRYNVLEDGTVRIVASSRTGNAFVGSEGWVASLAIEAPYDAKPGDYFAEFRNVNFIDPMKQSFGVSKYISKFSVIPNAPGDVNADGAIDEDDVRGIAGFIVNKPLVNCSRTAADIDSDGIINILDCVKEVNNILK